MTRTERLHSDKLNGCVARAHRCISLIALLWIAALTAGIVLADLDVPSAGEVLSRDHQYSTNAKILQTRFSDTAHFDVAIYFGVEDYNPQFYDVAGIGKWETEKVGGPIFDPRFDISSKVAQFYSLYFCAYLRI